MRRSLGRFVCAVLVLAPGLVAAVESAPMKQAGNRCELVANEGGAHGYLMFDQVPFEETMKRSIEFLTSLGCLKQKP